MGIDELSCKHLLFILGSGLRTSSIFCQFCHAVRNDAQDGPSLICDWFYLRMHQCKWAHSTKHNFETHCSSFTTYRCAEAERSLFCLPICEKYWQHEDWLLFYAIVTYLEACHRHLGNDSICWATFLRTWPAHQHRVLTLSESNCNL